MRFDPRHPPTPRPPLLQGPSSRPAAVPPPRLLAFLTWLAAVPPARPGVRACSRPPPTGKRLHAAEPGPASLPPPSPSRSPPLARRRPTRPATVPPPARRAARAACPPGPPDPPARPPSITISCISERAPVSPGALITPPALLVRAARQLQHPPLPARHAHHTFGRHFENLPTQAA